MVKVVNISGTPYVDLEDGVLTGQPNSRVPIADNEPTKPTFSATLLGIVPGATPTDLLVIKGAAGKLIRLKEMIISGTATAASNVLFQLIRRSSPNSGGTNNGITPYSHDILDGVSLVTLTQYTANATGLGTAVGTLHGARLNLAPAANGSIDRLLWDWSWKNEKAILLRGASDFVALNLNGVAWPAGGVLDIDLTYTEENV